MTKIIPIGSIVTHRDDSLPVLVCSKDGFQGDWGLPDAQDLPARSCALVVQRIHLERHRPIRLGTRHDPVGGSVLIGILIVLKDVFDRSRCECQRTSRVKDSGDVVQCRRLVVELGPIHVVGRVDVPW